MQLNTQMATNHKTFINCSNLLLSSMSRPAVSSLVLLLVFMVSCLLVMAPAKNFIMLKETREGDQQHPTYTAPIDGSTRGQPFYSINMSDVEILLPSPIKLRRKDLKDFVVVSAVSANYFKRLTKLVASVQRYFPKNKVIIYDLGLTDKEHAQARRLCQVEVRKFPFHKYPAHVRELHSYAFKPLAVAETFMDPSVKGVFWADGSIRFKTSNMSLLNEKSMRSDGMAVFTGTEHSVFSVTMPEMFDYLPMVRDSKMYECLIATTVLMYRTEKVVRDILKWWVVCALSKECIWNRAYSGCPFAANGRNRWTEFGYCSRYDQSALSILLYNAYLDYDDFLTYRIWGPGAFGDFLDITRWDWTNKLKLCR